MKPWRIHIGMEVEKYSSVFDSSVFDSSVFDSSVFDSSVFDSSVCKSAWKFLSGPGSNTGKGKLFFAFSRLRDIIFD